MNNTAVINIRTESALKTQAQEIAANLGFSLSSLVNAFLKQLVRTKTVSFSTAVEEPSDYLIQALKESEADRVAGRTSPTFDNADDAIAALLPRANLFSKTPALHEAPGPALKLI